MTTETLEFNPDLEPETLTDREKTKELPCRECGRRCIVTQFASPAKTECTTCRGQHTHTAAPEAELQFNPELETEVLTDREETKELPCCECGRRCVVTLFATAAKVKCLTCRGKQRAERRQEVQVAQAHTVNPSTLENLADALVNPVFRNVPMCPFDTEHTMELKSVVHSAYYGPRRFAGWVKGQPRWDQETGESVTYQCLECLAVVSFSTMHPIPLKAQNEARRTASVPVRALEAILGARVA